MTGAGDIMISKDSPYPGLRSFTRSEFHIFFGRDQHIAEMTSKLSENWFLCVTGPSGCGKSSLARTGLFNALEAGFLQGRGSDWIFCDLHPETDPIDRLCAALATSIVLGESGRDTPEPDAQAGADIAQLTSLFKNHIEDRSSNLTGALANIPMIAGRPIVILIDQFEEIFRYAQDDPQSASRFVDILLKTAAARQDVYVVITIRTDELAKCARYSGLTAAINHSQFLTPTLDRFQMQEAIEGPASLFNGRVEPALSVWMLNALEEQLDKLPLMQHALRLLYVNARRDVPEGPITLGLKDFFEAFEIERSKNSETSGGHDALRTSLSHRLSTLYGRLEENDQRIARSLFCALTTLESQSRDIRRPIKLGDAEKTIECSFDDLVRVIKIFKEGSESYLRIAGEHDGIDRGDTVDVSHECILRLWRPLQEEWLPQEAGSAENIRFLARMARERDLITRNDVLDRWLGRGLMTGNTLRRYFSWWSEGRFNATWAARHLERVKWEEDDEPLSHVKKFQRVDVFMRSSRRYEISRLVVLACVALGVLGAGGIWMVSQQRWKLDQAQNRVKQAEQKAKTEILEVEIQRAGEAQRQSQVWQLISTVAPSKDARLPVQIASQAAVAYASSLEHEMPQEALTEASNKLYQSLNYVHELRRFDHGMVGSSGIYSADFLPDGNRIVAVTSGLELVLWDRMNNAEPLHRISLGQAQTKTEGRSGRSLAVSSDGTIAVGTQRGALLLVEGVDTDDTEPKILELFSGHVRWRDYNSIYSVAFSSDGERLAAASLTGHIHLWSRLPDGNWGPRRTLAAPDLDNSDGAKLEPSDGSEVFSRNLSVWSVALSGNGSIAAAGFGNGGVCLFAFDTGNSFCSTEGHSAPVKALDFSPEGRTLLSGGNDDMLRIWSLEHLTEASAPSEAMKNPPNARLSPIVLWHDSDVWSADFDVTGSIFATASWDGSVRLFEVGTWRPLRTLRGHEQALRTVRFAPEGTQLLSASIDKTARLWTPFSSRLSESELYWFPPGAASAAHEIASVALGPDAGWIAFTDRYSVWIRPKAGEARQVHPVGDGDATTPSTLASARRGDFLVVAMQEPEVRIWRRDVGGDWTVRRVLMEGAEVRDRLSYRHVAVSADGTQYAVSVAGADGKAVLVCDSQAERCSGDDGMHIAKVPFSARVEDGRTSDNDPSGCIRDASLSALALSANGKWLAAGGTDCNIRLFDLVNPDTAARVMAKHVGNILSLDFSANGEVIAASSADWWASLWHPESGEARMLKGSEEHGGHRSAVDAIRMLPSGNYAVTASRDEELIVWDALTAKPVMYYPTFEYSLNALDVSMARKGTAIATGNKNGEVSTVLFFEQRQDVLGFARSTLEKVTGANR